MLERIDFIKNVGLFADHTQQPGTDFDELTLVFGENGVGKTTVAAIIDSLRERNPGTIVRRRSLPGHADPTCGVSVDGKAYAFDGTDWDGQPAYGTIDVFFPDFVTRNVHAGGGVATEHKRNLCEFVLGRKAVLDVEKLAQADADARAALSDMKQVDQKLTLLVKPPDNLQSFLALKEDRDIDVRIAAARAALAEATAAEKVMTRPVPCSVSLLGPSREQLLATLALTDGSISGDIASTVNGHVDAVLGERGERWLDYGSERIVDDKCPFCTQDVTGVGFVEAVRQYFGPAYRALLASVDEGLTSVRSAAALTVFNKAKADLSSQLAVAMQWHEQHAVDTLTIERHLESASTSWAKASELLEKVLVAKQSSPLDVIAPDDAEAAFAHFEAAVAHVGTVNAMLTACATSAEAHKKALASADKAKLADDVARLENQKTRHSEPVLTLFAEGAGHLKRRKDAEAEKLRLKAAIGTHANAVVGKYEDGINHFLQHFGCDLRIGKVEAAFPSGKASVSYKLTVRGHDVPLASVADEPCFDSVLSEGDKYSLALAFFLARLKDAGDLAGRVIVFDDPVNSLGGSRRRLVEGVIRDLRKRGAQVIVLTHDERLAAMLWRDSTKIGSMKKIVPLQVERTGAGSRLVPWDAERATRSEYVEDYLMLVGFLDGDVDHSTAAACVRPYVEQRLRHLFPGPPLESRDTLGIMMGKIRAAQPGDRIHPLQDKLAELEAIGDAGP
jgi:wobble nucleotide-excising tRNase